MIRLNSKGITMMETVIALGVLVTGLISVMSLSASSISLSKETEMQIVVTNLAREGLEIVKQTRDYSKSGYASSVFADADYRFFDTDGSAATEEVPEGCYIVDSETDGNFGLKTGAINASCVGDSFNISACTNCGLYQTLSSGLYSHDSSGDSTVFSRAVKIKTESAIEKRVFSKVTWTEKGRSHEYVLESVLTDW